MLGGKGPFLGIKAQIRGAEETKFIVYQIGVLRKNERDLTGAVISFKDVSKEHRLEEELFRQDQNRVMRLQVSEFIHEIKTPMTSIKTLADLLPAKVHNPDFQIQFVEIINSEMERLSLIHISAAVSRPWPPFWPGSGACRRFTWIRSSLPPAGGSGTGLRR